METIKREIKVDMAGAKIFYEQCMGSHSGHMAAIPNNPVILSICRAHGVSDKSDFAKFLKKVAEQLEKEPF